MCWGFECGDGWLDIIDSLCGVIQGHIDNSVNNCRRNIEFLKVRDAALVGDWSLFDECYAHLDASAEWLGSRKADLLKELPVWRTVVTPIHQVVATQVKEKFGTLRFYYEGGDDYIDGAVSMAEAMSAVTCEVCSVPAEIRTTRTPVGWIMTLCDECWKKE
jgi:hypothetical protein